MSSCPTQAGKVPCGLRLRIYGILGFVKIKSETSFHQPPASRLHPALSWLMFLSFGLFIASSLYILGYLVFKTHIEKQAFKALPPNGQSEFIEWANAPLAMPIPPLGDSVSTCTMKARQQFKDAAFAIANKVPAIKAARPTIITRILSGTGFSATEWETVTSFTLQFAPVVSKAQNLVARKDYTFSPRSYPGPVKSLVGWSTISTYFCIYIIGTVHKNDWNAALESIEAAFRLIRSDPGSLAIYEALHSIILSKILNTVTWVSEQTSDTAVLRQLLDTLSSSQASIPSEPVDYVSLYYRQMQSDGYLAPGLPTPSQDEDAVFERDKYLKWLLNTLPPASERHQWTQEALASYSRYYGSGPAAGILPKLDIGLAKPFVRPFVRLNTLPDFVRFWKFKNERRLADRATAASYHLLRLRIASRIAQLEGKLVPTAPADFVPAYLSYYPADPFSSAPFTYSYTRQAHYSAGPDATFGTIDDIYLRLFGDAHHSPP